MTRVRGFSLLEVLVVTTVIAVAGAIAVPALVEGDEARGRREARRLAAALGAAAQEALLSGHPQAFAPEADGYGFDRREAPGRWRPATGPLLERHRLPEGVRIARILTDGATLAPDRRLVFPPSADHAPFEIHLSYPGGGVRVVGTGMEEPHVEAQ